MTYGKDSLPEPPLLILAGHPIKALLLSEATLTEMSKFLGAGTRTGLYIGILPPPHGAKEASSYRPSGPDYSTRISLLPRSTASERDRRGPGGPEARDRRRLAGVRPAVPRSARVLLQLS